MLSATGVGRLALESVGAGSTGAGDADEASAGRGSDNAGIAVSDTRRAIVGRFKRFVRRVTGAIVATGTGVSAKLMTTGGGDGGPHAKSPTEKVTANARHTNPRRGIQQKEWLAARHHLTPVGPLPQVLWTPVATDRRSSDHGRPHSQFTVWRPLTTGSRSNAIAGSSVTSRTAIPNSRTSSPSPTSIGRAV